MHTICSTKANNEIWKFIFCIHIFLYIKVLDLISKIGFSLCYIKSGDMINKIGLTYKNL